MTSSLRTIAGHRLVAGLGQGGMARVYLAISQKQLGFTKLVVLKVLRDELDVDGALLDMFIQEARLAARLNHLHVVQTYEAGEDDGRHYIAMEYLEGQALSSVVARAGSRLPLEAHLRILCDTLEGLQYVHDLTDYDGTPLGLVHRDVSPQNVFVTYSGQAKVIDFGIAKSFDSTRTVNGMLKGKIGYMAPEQARVGGVPDRRTDVFAVGVMLWEALAGRRLVERGEQEMMALGRRISGEDPKIREVAPDAPSALADVCDKAMASEPADRFSSASEMRDAIEACLADRPSFDARQVALLLEETFAKERTRLRQLVDEKVKEAFDPGPLVDLHTEGTVTPPRGPRAQPTDERPGVSSDGPPTRFVGPQPALRAE
ncbi:MAG TPA: serine/threonine-protein kinase, partial [Labilithrix sp.]|nr:serine/threonine-protein kinase [Labilithrix sp.]